jgi:uncharacterized protein YciI
MRRPSNIFSILSALSAAALAMSALAAPTPQAPPDMKVYQLVVFRSGPNKDVPPADAQRMQQAHLEGLTKLNTERVNLLFGPFLDKTDLRALAVLDVPDAAAAKKALADDPFIKAGHMVVEVKPWLCKTNLFELPETPYTPENLILGFLMSGPNRKQSEAEAAEIQKGHIAYLEEMGRKGKLLAAGPFLEDADWRGLVIYRVGTVDEAKEIAAGDPAVKAGRLVLDARPWMTFKGILK